MAAKRSRDIEGSTQPQIPPPPTQQSLIHANPPFPKKDASEALPTLTNWGGGHAEGSSVVSNARLTNQQRSTIQRAVCSYFLQNKFVHTTHLLGSTISLVRHAYSFFSDAAKALIACTATTLTFQSKQKCEHSCHPDLDPPNNLIQVCFPLCWKVQKWTQLHVSNLLLQALAADEDSVSFTQQSSDIPMTASCNLANFCLAVVSVSTAAAVVSAIALPLQRRWRWFKTSGKMEESRLQKKPLKVVHSWLLTHS